MNTVAQTAGRRRPVAVWLLVCCAMVFAMVVVGGVTRLTHSGLSIVEWQPIVGAVPPLTAEQWNETFLKYQQTPEYKLVNRGMGLADFQGIFWWEYAHRLLGRLIGAVFLLPLLYFAWMRRLPRSMLPRLAVMFLLGGMQGALGWYMVQSGLVDDPRVSQYRLTAHLGLAVLIYGAMLWTALDLLWGKDAAAGRLLRWKRAATGLSALIFLMMLSGGFVAGIHAGLSYNTFPLMSGHWLPPEAFLLEPWYLNFFNNMALVQFDHRAIGWLLVVLIPTFFWASRAAGMAVRTRRLALAMLVMLAVQVTLGISTLLLAVPVALAAMHQAGAMLLLTFSLAVSHEAARQD